MYCMNIKFLIRKHTKIMSFTLWRLWDLILFFREGWDISVRNQVPNEVHSDDCQSCPPGYEPLAPPPPAAASVPVWQDRTIASSRLRLLEYSAFVEVQRDPDTVMCLGVG